MLTLNMNTHKHKTEVANLENSHNEICEVCEVEQKTCDTCAHEHLHHEHEIEGKKSTSWEIVLQAAKHTFEIFAFILIANLVLTIIIQLLGGPKIMETIVGKDKWYQPTT